MGSGGSFVIHATSGKARKGTIITKSGNVNTPAFMAVGTQATVKAVNPAELRTLGAEIVLSNTYHLHLRPGDELIKEHGGLHKFMGWTGPILTDSGGFQVFSLSKLRRITSDGVYFRSHHDGLEVFFSPEKVVQIQENLDVDIMMVLDECLTHTASEQEANSSLDLTLAWAKRSLEARTDPKRLMFGIVQGGMYLKLRERAIEALRAMPFDGYAIGGLSVGEPTEELYRLTEFSSERLPADRVRYLMGVGMPHDIVYAVAAGVDLFDCVIPTRSARFGRLFLGNSFLNIRNSRYRRDALPIEEGCDCYTCQNFSRAYLAHLIHEKEILGNQLATIHNLRYYQRLMSRLRVEIENDTLASFVREFFSR